MKKYLWLISLLTGLIIEQVALRIHSNILASAGLILVIGFPFFAYAIYFYVFLTKKEADCPYCTIRRAQNRKELSDMSIDHIKTVGLAKHRIHVWGLPANIIVTLFWLDIGVIVSFALTLFFMSRTT